MFQQGQAVVCIDGEFPAGIESMYTALPIEGGSYTIRDIAPGQTFRSEPEIAVTLQELSNPIGEGGLERAFSAERFEPLEEIILDRTAESDVAV